MNTQAQLRAVLAARAAEDRPGLAVSEKAIADTLRLALAPPARAIRRRSRRLVVCGLVAAGVAALVVVPSLLGESARIEPAVRPPISALPPTSSAQLPSLPNVVPAPRVTSPGPTDRRPSSTPGTATSPSSVPTHVPSPGHVTSTAVTNLISIGGQRSVLWDRRSEMEFAIVQLPGEQHAEVAAYPLSSTFGRSRISDAQPVIVGGRPGWFGNVSVWPADGRPDPVSGKQDGAVPSVVWQVDGIWVVVQTDSGATAPTAAASFAAALQIRAATPRITLPFFVRHLPVDLRLNTAGHYEKRGKDSLFGPSWTLSLVTGKSDIQVSLVPDAEVSGDGASGAVRPLTRSFDGYQIQVSGTGFTATELSQVLAGVTVVDDPAVETGAWPTLADALP